MEAMEEVLTGTATILSVTATILPSCVDASFADNYGDQHENRRSTTGWCFKSGGSLLSWRAQKQSTVATSTAEAEYMAAFEAAKEAAPRA